VLEAIALRRGPWQIVQGMGFSNRETGFIVALPYMVALAVNVRIGSESATQGDGRECPILLKADIQHGRAQCLGFAGSGHSYVKPTLVRTPL
jgi:hypothetical protein